MGSISTSPNPQPPPIPPQPPPQPPQPPTTVSQPPPNSRPDPTPQTAPPPPRPRCPDRSPRPRRRGPARSPRRRRSSRGASCGVRWRMWCCWLGPSGWPRHGMRVDWGGMGWMEVGSKGNLSLPEISFLFFGLNQMEEGLSDRKAMKRSKGRITALWQWKRVCSLRLGFVNPFSSWEGGCVLELGHLNSPSPGLQKSKHCSSHFGLLAFREE